MRRDMAKVICEEPRNGLRLKDRKGRKRAESRTANEDKPLREGSLQRRWSSNWGDHKEFGEHLSPLKRYILSCVGRPWDDVYSEIRQNISMNNVVQKHILTHIWQFVALNVYVENSVIYDLDYSGHTGRDGNDLPIHQLTYVDPASGILTKNPHLESPRKRRKKENSSLTVPTGEAGTAYYHMNGLWYLISYRDLPLDKKSAHGYDVLYHEEWAWDTTTIRLLKTTLTYSNKSNVARHFSRYYGAPIYCTQKKSCNKKEVKRIKQWLTSQSLDHHK